MGCYIWYTQEGPGRAAAPPSPFLAVPNVTAHRPTASVPITVLLYDGPLLCGFSVAIKGLNSRLTGLDSGSGIARMTSAAASWLDAAVARRVVMVGCSAFEHQAPVDNRNYMTFYTLDRLLLGVVRCPSVCHVRVFCRNE